MSTNIQWLTLLRTINIILVVMFHIQLIDLSTGENNEICNRICYPFNPIRMPLFIFISGGLLYISRLSRNWQTIDLYKDKIKRIVIPFVFFVNVYFIVKAMLNQFVKTPIDISLSYYIESFAVYYNHPSAPLWFLATLMTLMLLYPLYQYACKNIVVMIITLIVGTSIYFMDFGDFLIYNYFNISNINQYFVYFFFGIVFFRYSLFKYIDNYLALSALLFIYVVTYHFDFIFIASISGIMLMISLSILLSKHINTDFSFIGNNIYQIYLMSFIFQAFVELVLWKKLFYNENLFFVFYLLNLSFGVFMPLLVTRMVKKCPIRIVRLCFGVK